MGLFFCICLFSRWFLENQTNVWENQKYPNKPKKTETTFGKPQKTNKQNNTYPRVGLKPLTTVLFSRMFCVFFFGFILYCWFSIIFYLFSKNLRENQQQHKQPNPYPRVGLKPLKTMFLGFPEYLFGFL